MGWGFPGGGFDHDQFRARSAFAWQPLLPIRLMLRRTIMSATHSTLFCPVVQRSRVWLGQSPSTSTHTIFPGRSTYTANTSQPSVEARRTTHPCSSLILLSTMAPSRSELYRRSIMEIPPLAMAVSGLITLRCIVAVLDPASLHSIIRPVSGLPLT